MGWQHQRDRWEQTVASFRGVNSRPYEAEFMCGPPFLSQGDSMDSALEVFDISLRKAARLLGVRFQRMVRGEADAALMPKRQQKSARGCVRCRTKRRGLIVYSANAPVISFSPDRKCRVQALGSRSRPGAFFSFRIDNRSRQGSERRPCVDRL